MAGAAGTGFGVTGGGRGERMPLRRAYDGATSSLRSVRTDLLGWLADGGAGDEVRERAALVVSELAANAVQAAPGRRFAVDATWADPHVVVTVRNETDGDRPPRQSSWGPVDALAPRGRGLAIVDALADGVSVDDAGGDVVVTARLRLDGRDRSA